jgi:FtsZ-binding cell division protein ZapB
MQEGFEVLEEKVRKAADLVKRLRRANRELEEERGRLGGRLREAEKRLDALEKEADAPREDGPREEALTQEVARWRHEREEIRRRIERIVEVLEAALE